MSKIEALQAVLSTKREDLARLRRKHQLRDQRQSQLALERELEAQVRRVDEAIAALRHGLVPPPKAEDAPAADGGRDEDQDLDLDQDQDDDLYGGEPFEEIAAAAAATLDTRAGARGRAVEAGADRRRRQLARRRCLSAGRRPRAVAAAAAASATAAVTATAAPGERAQRAARARRRRLPRCQLPHRARPDA